MALEFTDPVGPNVSNRKETVILSDGTIALPVIGRVPAANLTATQVGENIIQAFRESNVLPGFKTVRVTVLTGPCKGAMGLAKFLKG